MKRQLPFLPLILIVALIISGCKKQSEEAHILPSKFYHFSSVSKAELDTIQEIYVPVYSNIYYKTGHHRFPLTATLSIRNTSKTDTMYVFSADYYDSEGNLKREYLKDPIEMYPLQSVEMVVEEKNTEGGAGANFLVTWGANSKDLKPIIQSVMIGTTSSQGISFVIEGTVVE